MSIFAHQLKLEMRKTLIFIILLAFVMVANVAHAQKFVLVIDAGHGGKDPGALGKITNEKSINLQVALAFGKYVENNCKDVKVVYTRTTDVFVPLIERANIANKNKADLFISIHTNALDGGKISRGFETYTLGMHRASDNLNVAKRENSVILIEKNYKQSYAGFDPKSSESYIMFELMQDKNMSNSVELAKFIQHEVCSTSGRVNKGVHQAGFLVLRETSMPSCLIELGFITTPDEEEYLNSKEGQDKIAKGIYNAFVKYKKKYGQHKLSQSDEEKTESDDNLMAEAEKTEVDASAKENLLSEENTLLAEYVEYAPQRAVRQNFFSETKAEETISPTVSAPEVSNQKQQEASPPQIAPPKANDTNLESNNEGQQPPPTPTEPQSVSAPKEQKGDVAANLMTGNSDYRQPTAQQPKPAQDNTLKNNEETPAAQNSVIKSQPERHDAGKNTKKAENANDIADADKDKPSKTIFKVQIAATSVDKPKDEAFFTGIDNVGSFTENGMVKYTVGECDDFAKVQEIRNSLSEKFPGAFIIAFKNGEKISVQEAMKEYRNN